MKHPTILSRAAALAVAFVLATACQSTPNEATKRTLANTEVASGVVDVDPAALDILKRAANHIRSAKSLRVRTVTGFDVVQDDGQKVEFGSTFHATVLRPDRARLESTRRDGERLVVTLDGNDLWMYSPDHGVYAHEPQPGDIDASFDHMLDELGISTPLHNLFSEELGASLGTDLIQCYVVGETTIGELRCHHIAARNAHEDFQVWIDVGDVPALRRLVVSYREEAGHPQYWAYFTDWEFDVKTDSRTFVFQPPAGTERIRLAHTDDGEE